MIRADQVRYPMRDHTGFAAAGAGQNQHRAFGCFYSFTLLGIEARKKVHYRTIFALLLALTIVFRRRRLFMDAALAARGLATY